MPCWRVASGIQGPTARLVDHTMRHGSVICLVWPWFFSSFFLRSLAACEGNVLKDLGLLIHAGDLSPGLYCLLSPPQQLPTACVRLTMLEASTSNSQARHGLCVLQPVGLGNLVTMVEPVGQTEAKRLVVHVTCAPSGVAGTLSDPDGHTVLATTVGHCLRLSPVEDLYDGSGPGTRHTCDQLWL